jgi:hypothetical protein
MPRGFRYEHFTVPPSAADPDRTRRDKQEVSAKPGEEVRHGRVRYGKRFAKTEAILHARAESRAKEPQPGQPPPEPEPRPRRAAPRSAATDPSPPLGATPTEELPPATEQDLAQTPLELLAAFRDQAVRSVEGMGGAVRQVRTAGLEMARLPVEALRLLIRIGRIWLGGSPRRA